MATQSVFTVRYNGGKRSEVAKSQEAAIKMAQKWIQAPERQAGECVEVIGDGWHVVEGPAQDALNWPLPSEWGRLAVIFEAGIADWVDVLLTGGAVPWGKLPLAEVQRIDCEFQRRLAA